MPPEITEKHREAAEEISAHLLTVKGISRRGLESILSRHFPSSPPATQDIEGIVVEQISGGYVVNQIDSEGKRHTIRFHNSKQTCDVVAKDFRAAVARLTAARDMARAELKRSYNDIERLAAIAARDASLQAVAEHERDAYGEHLQAIHSVVGTRASDVGTGETALEACQRVVHERDEAVKALEAERADNPKRAGCHDVADLYRDDEARSNSVSTSEQATALLEDAMQANAGVSEQEPMVFQRESFLPTATNTPLLHPLERAAWEEIRTHLDTCRWSTSYIDALLDADKGEKDE